jgi:hypothetical protein
MPFSVMLRRVALVRTDVSEEHSASIIRVRRFGELGITLAVTSNRRTLRSFTMYSNISYVPPKLRLLQETHGLTSQKTEFFIVTAVKTSNLTTTLLGPLEKANHNHWTTGRGDPQGCETPRLLIFLDSRLS